MKSIPTIILTLIAIACIPAAAFGGYYKGKSETYEHFIAYQIKTMNDLGDVKETKHAK